MKKLLLILSLALLTGNALAQTVGTGGAGNTGGAASPNNNYNGTGNGNSGATRAPGNNYHGAPTGANNTNVPNTNSNTNANAPSNVTPNKVIPNNAVPNGPTSTYKSRKAPAGNENPYNR